MNQSGSLKPRAQEAAWNRLIKMAGALPQGLILVGPAGVGKKRSVLGLYQWLHCHENPGQSENDPNQDALFSTPAQKITNAIALENLPCGECVSCRKIAEGKHADILTVVPTGETIAVDDLREMKKSLYFPPLEGRYRFVIIDDAHKLSGISANTLLKTLEEPPAHTRFFLLTHERALLLPTITSRCQFIHFAPLDKDTLRALLTEKNCRLPANLEDVCLDLLAGGMARIALLEEPKVQAFLGELLPLLGELANPRTRQNAWQTVSKVADQLSSGGAGEEWKLELFLDLLVRDAHQRVTSAASKTSASPPDELLADAVRSLEAAGLRRRLTRNANRKLIALAAAALASEHSMDAPR